MGIIRFTGADAREFLQGQLTHDLKLLSPQRPLLAACCTPQGRVIAALRLQEDADGILAHLPSSMIEPTLAKLRRYVLRSKVTMTALPDEQPESDATRLRDIEAGQPQIYPQTTEAFVAQMLNLDLIDGISFNKGCYTGQEIIARAHYRGQVKRRMQRLRTLQPHALTPGDQGHLQDGRSFTVVQAAPLPDGRCEFLAVAPLHIADSADIPPDALPAEPLPLPYPLPVGPP